MKEIIVLSASQTSALTVLAWMHVLQSAPTPEAGWWSPRTCVQRGSRPNSRPSPPAQSLKKCRKSRRTSCKSFTPLWPCLLLKLLGILAPVLIEVRANLRGESESWWHRQSNGSHFRKVGTLPTKQVLHFSSAVGLHITWRTQT